MKCPKLKAFHDEVIPEVTKLEDSHRKLVRSLYGLKRACKEANENFDEVKTEMGYHDALYEDLSIISTAAIKLVTALQAEV